MGLLDKLLKKNRPQNNMYGPGAFNGYYQQPYGNSGYPNPYGVRPQYGERPAYHLPQQHAYQQNYYQPSHQPFNHNQGYFQQQQVAGQPQLNAYQQYVNQNKLLQSVPFQNQPVVQSHNSSILQQPGAQSPYPMTGQPPDRQNGEKTGLLSRVLGGDSSITGIIGNMQRAVQTAQQVTPLITQYGPIVKNLPSLYKIFKEVNSDDPIESKKNQKKEINQERTPTQSKKRKNNQIINEDVPFDLPAQNTTNSMPKPKLFM